MKTWSEKELRELHAEHLAGAWVSDLAKRRRRPAGTLAAAWKKIGLRPLPPKPKGGRKRVYSDAEVAAWHAAWMAGESLNSIERRHGLKRHCVRCVFVGRKLALRPPAQGPVARQRDGTFRPLVPKTEAQISALIAAATRLRVPAELALEWRQWDWPRRADFLARMRRHLADPADQPDLPFSANLTPFDYCTPAAREIVAAANFGLDSRRARAKLDFNSQGVIWDGVLWFWNRVSGFYVEGIRWVPGRGRKVLSRAIWERFRGAIPAGWVVRCLDRNPNNLDPANLHLVDRNEVMRENQVRALAAKSRRKVELLLSNQTKPNQPHEHRHILHQIGARRVQS